MEHKKIVGIYTRISLDRTGASIGVSRQQLDCVAIAGVRWPGAEIVYYSDNDTSAYQPRARRQAYARMLADIRDGRVAAVVAWNLDRLLRQPRQLEELIDLGAIVVTAQGDLDLTTHDGQLHARILAAVAKKSSDDTSRRVKRAAVDRAEAGRFHGGRYTPFGLARQPDGTYTVSDIQAQIVVDVARRVLAGDKLAAIVREIPADVGAPATREAWRVLLTGPTIRGRNAAGHVATWQPIIDPATAAALHGALATRSRTRPNRRWPLSPVLRCGVCGDHMVGCTGRYQHYGCRNGRCVAISAPQLELYVDAALDTAVIVVEREVAPRRDLRAEAALEHLAAEYASGQLTRGEWEAARRSVASAPGDSPAAIPRVLVDPDGQPLRLDGWQRLSAIDHITVDKARAKGVRFDDSRVHITWRH